MVYVAFLRGINVGGKSIVSMATLKTGFEQLGLSSVKTYINSGNVIFSSDKNATALTEQIESTLEKEFDNNIKVLVKTHDQIKELVAQIPASWTNDKAMRCDVLFLWPAIDRPEVLQELPINPSVDEVHYHPGAVIWRLDRTNYTKSRLPRIIGTPLYKQVTIRNLNTTRKVLELMNAAA